MSLRRSNRRRAFRVPGAGPARSNRRLAWIGTVLLLFGTAGGLPGLLFAQDTAPPPQAPRAGKDDTPPERQPSALAQFTTGIEDREPVDQITFVPNDVRKIFFFSDLRGLAGQTVRHRWIYDGRTMAEVRFDVRGPRWRIWSSKELMPDWIGNWTVEIVTADDEVIATETFTYSAPDA